MKDSPSTGFIAALALLLLVAACGELPQAPGLPQAPESPQFYASGGCPWPGWVDCEQMDADQAQLLLDALDAHFALGAGTRCGQARTEIRNWLTFNSNSWVYMASFGGEPGGVVVSGNQPQHVGFVSWLWSEAPRNIARVVLHEGFHLAFGDHPPGGFNEDACLNLD